MVMKKCSSSRSVQTLDSFSGWKYVDKLDKEDIPSTRIYGMQSPESPPPPLLSSNLTQKWRDGTYMYASKRKKSLYIWFKPNFLS